MTERIPCKSQGCSATILPTTAAKTGGICMPCHQKEEREKHEAYIKQHRKTVNLYEGLTDPVDILKIMHAPRKYDPLIQYVNYPLSKAQVYTLLTREAASRMLSYALDLLIAGDDSEAVNILLSLVCYRNDNITEILSKLIEHGMYDSSILFKDAPPDMRDQLLQQVEWDDDHRNHLLFILGWIGDSIIVERFQEWRMHAPEWSEELSVAPESYALEAGWELTANGEKRPLAHDLCYAIRTDGEQCDEPADASAAHFLQTCDSPCPWCARRLTILIDVDTSHPSLKYLDLSMERLQVATCEHCGGFSTIFMELNHQCTPVWSRFNLKPEYLPHHEEEHSSDVNVPALTLLNEPHSPFYASVWTLSQQGSQIGGHPSWVQDADYPQCPCCSQRMRFIGQMDWADYEPYGEGIFYMFICTDDRLTATLYQQS